MGDRRAIGEDFKEERRPGWALKDGYTGERDKGKEAVKGKAGGGRDDPETVPGEARLWSPQSLSYAVPTLADGVLRHHWHRNPPPGLHRHL